MGSEFLLVAFLMLAGMGVYWTMVLFPRQRDFKRRQEMARSLSEGDEVITGGGLIGRVKRIDSAQGIAYIEVAEGLEVRVLTAAMIDRYDPELIARNSNQVREKQQSVPQQTV